MSRLISRFLSIDSVGRIVLPADLRRRLSLSVGSRLRLDVVAERIQLTPDTEADPVFGMSATKRVVLRPTRRVFDAVAATRAGRVPPVRRRGG